MTKREKTTALVFLGLNFIMVLVSLIVLIIKRNPSVVFSLLLEIVGIFCSIALFVVRDYLKFKVSYETKDGSEPADYRVNTAKMVLYFFSSIAIIGSIVLLVTILNH